MCGSGCRRRLCPTVIAVGTGQSHDLPGTRPPAPLVFFFFLPLVILSLSSFSFLLLFPPFCLPLSLSLYIYILFVAWLLITNRCLDLDRRLAVRAPKLRVLLFDESPPLLPLSGIFKFLDSRGRDRNGSVIQLLIADCWFHAAMDGDCILRGSRFLFRNVISSFERSCCSICYSVEIFTNI